MSSRQLSDDEMLMATQRAEIERLRAEMCASAAAIGSALFEYDEDKLVAARQILLRALNGGDDG